MQAERTTPPDPPAPPQARFSASLLAESSNTLISPQDYRPLWEMGWHDSGEESESNMTQTI